jgi:polyisoprenyl-phosphate glycosyltransferase
MPVYNDWGALSLLLPQLDHELYTSGLQASIFIVDDGSTIAFSENLCSPAYRSIRSIDVLSLRRNLGHQRAIATGLSYIEAHIACQYVVIMDGDGEDDPSDVPRLVQKCLANNDRIVFASRIRRSEGLLFRCFYQLYRLMHFALTGVKVRVGNFSVIPVASLRRLVSASELWNHYAAAVHKAKLSMELIPTRRAARLAGPSHMDIVSLVVHGLSAMAVFGDRIGVRLLLLVFVGMVFDIAALLSVIGIRLFTSWAIPGWTTYAVGILFVILIQMFVVVLVFAFVILASRDRVNFIPRRDYVHITGEIQRLYEQVS